MIAETPPERLSGVLRLRGGGGECVYSDRFPGEKKESDVHPEEDNYLKAGIE